MADIVRLEGVYKPGAQSPVIGICIYGQGGSGKTTLVGTMPGHGLVLDVPQIEGGSFVLDQPGVRERIDIKPVETWDELEKVYWHLNTGKSGYQWVAPDSLTAMTELAKRKTIKERPLDLDPHMISMQEWGKIGRLVADLVYKFRTLPLHTIWIAQERKLGGDDEIDKRTQLVPDTTPSALQALIPSMTLVGRLSVEQAPGGTGVWERHLRIGPHPIYYTKYRAKPGLDIRSTIRNPRLDVLLKFLVAGGPPPEWIDEAAMAATEGMTIVSG